LPARRAAGCVELGDDRHTLPLIFFLALPTKLGRPLHY
jgi:hypothetical protein